MEPEHIILSVDIETLGTALSSPILSVAVKTAGNSNFDHSIHHRTPFDLVVAENAYGVRLPCPDTLVWWNREDREAALERAKAETLEGATTHKHTSEMFKALHRDLTALVGSIEATGRDYTIWGNGASFDLGMLAYHFERLGMSRPWNGFTERDMRTLNEVNWRLEGPSRTFPAEDAHDALADAEAQAKSISDWREYVIDLGQRLAETNENAEDGGHFPEADAIIKLAKEAFYASKDTPYRHLVLDRNIISIETHSDNTQSVTANPTLLASSAVSVMGGLMDEGKTNHSLIGDAMTLWIIGRLLTKSFVNYAEAEGVLADLEEAAVVLADKAEIFMAGFNELLEGSMTKH